MASPSHNTSSVKEPAITSSPSVTAPSPITSDEFSSASTQRSDRSRQRFVHDSSLTASGSTPQIPTMSNVSSYLTVNPTRPSLIASSNLDREPKSYSTWRVSERCAAPAASHPILPVWRHIVLPEIIRLVDRCSLPMTSILLLKLWLPGGYEMMADEEEQNAATIVRIGVNGDVSELSAMTLVQEIRTMLSSHGHGDIHVEVHRTKVEFRGFPRHLVDNPAGDDRAFRIPHQLGVGVDIARISQTASIGSGGIFLKLEGSDTTYLLTNQHVLDSSNTACRPFGSADQEGELVVQMSDMSLENGLKKIRSEISGLDEEHTAQMRTITSSAASERDIARAEGKLDDASNKRLQLLELLEWLERHWTDTESRVIGKVACYPQIVNNLAAYPPITTEINPGARAGMTPAQRASLQGFALDWGLIEIDPIGLDGLGSPNVLRILDYDWVKSTSLRFTFQPNVVRERAVRIAGVAPYADFASLAKRVTKLGAASGHTVGTVSPAIGALRISAGTSPNGTPIFAETPTFVLPIFGDGGKPFSAKGDTGSVAIDDRGMAVAHINGGEKINGEDVTFSTPMEFVFQDIKEFCGLSPSLA